MSCGSLSSPDLLGLPSQDSSSCLYSPPGAMPLGAAVATCQVDSGGLAFACKSTRVPWQPLDLSWHRQLALPSRSW